MKIRRHRGSGRMLFFVFLIGALFYYTACSEMQRDSDPVNETLQDTTILQVTPTDEFFVRERLPGGRE